MASALDNLLSRPAESRRLGPFHLDESRRLGQGGFAPVYLADEVHAGVVLRTVALKVFSLEPGAVAPASGSRGARKSSAGSARIIEEARALCRVEHPNVVRFYSLSTDDELGLIGIAMEYLAGTALSDVIAIAPCSVEAAVGVGESVASALVAVHRAGLIHRDVKPANIIEVGGVHKLIDFGIAASRAPRDAAPTEVSAPPVGPGPRRMDAMRDFDSQDFLTRATATFATNGAGELLAAGTMGYIDPACASGAPPTPSSDLYSLGATLFECLVGKLPATAAVTRPEVPAEQRGELFYDVLSGAERPPSVGVLREGLPADLVALIDALLAPKPEDRPPSAEAVAHTLGRVRAELKGRTRPLPAEETGPFRGLGRFEDADQDVFFGRSGEIASAIEVLRTRSSISLVGPSGSGKSSLARAGVAPAVIQGALGAWPPQWKLVVVTPGQKPYEALADALGAALEIEGAAKQTPSRLAAAVEAYPEKSGTGVLLLVDQLEELVTLSKTTDDAAALLVKLAERCVPGVRVISAARRDLLDGLLALSHDFGKYLSRSMQLVASLSDAAWADVLQQSFAAYKYRFEDDELRLQVLEQLSGTISAMPLVQFALTQLWAHRDAKRKVIGRSALDAIGGIAGALQRHAEGTYAALHVRGEAQTARRIFLALTTAQGTRSKKTRAELLKDAPEQRATLDTLTEARLVVEEPDGLTLAHEALLSQWPRLRGWVDAVRIDRQLAEELERAAAAWDASKDDTLLWRKRRLAGAEDLLRTDLVDVGAGARAFVRAGKSAQLRGRGVVAAGLAVLVAVGVAVTAIYIRDTRRGEAEALKQTQIATKAKEEAVRRGDDAVQAQASAVADRQRADNASKQCDQAKADVVENKTKIEQIAGELQRAKTDKERAEIGARLDALRAKQPDSAQPEPRTPLTRPQVPPPLPSSTNSNHDTLE